jgi:hypothetical protein
LNVIQRAAMSRFNGSAWAGPEGAAAHIFMEYQTSRACFSSNSQSGRAFMPIMARIRRIVFAALAAYAVPCAAWAAACDTAKAPTVPVVKGLPYAQARTAILASGWQAVVGHPHNDMSNNEVTFRDRGYTELQFCRLTDDSPCRFEFAAGGVSLWVATTGDENAMLGTQATVRSVKLACAGDPAPE